MFLFLLLTLAKYGSIDLSKFCTKFRYWNWSPPQLCGCIKLCLRSKDLAIPRRGKNRLLATESSRPGKLHGNGLGMRFPFYLLYKWYLLFRNKKGLNCNKSGKRWLLSKFTTWCVWIYRGEMDLSCSGMYM